MPPAKSSAPDVPRPAPAANEAGGGRDPLERLRQRVERAADELQRLRTENARLAERVNELGEETPPDDQDVFEPVSLVEGDPEALRDRIQQFIDALDRVLAERSAPPTSDQ